MEIDLQTKIGALLEAYPELEDTFLELSPAFAKLRNPVLRRTAAKIATVQQAAKIAGISPAAMVQALRRAAGLTAEAAEQPDQDSADEGRPAWFDESKIAKRFDAGPVIAAGKSPLQEILRLSEALSAGEILELSAPFRPEPVMDMLRTKGFQVWYDDGKSYFLKP